ncbi:hypothetical protein GCM10023096_38340 [Nonomuraea ferruginea]
MAAMLTQASTRILPLPPSPPRRPRSGSFGGGGAEAASLRAILLPGWGDLLSSTDMPL